MRPPVDRIEGLERDLEAFEALSPGPVAEKVAATGFRCRRCGKCCRGRYGDNTVTVFPSEIRAIAAVTGLDWLDFARPHESDDIDSEGFIHTFEWSLRKKDDGDCIFLENGACAIYDLRPLICRTYPFRLEAGELEVYECDGLETGATEDAGGMADALVGRQVVETSEAIALLKKLGDRPPMADTIRSHKKYIVHDSEGARLVVEAADGSLRFP